MFSVRSRYSIWFIATMALAAAGLACTAPGAPGASGGAATSQPIVTIAADTAAAPVTQGPVGAIAEPTETAQEEPAAVTEEPAAPPSTGDTAEHEGISFSFDSGVVGSWEVMDVPSDPAAEGMEFILVAQHVEFTFPDYPVDNLYQHPRIMVFPVSAWQNYNPSAEKRIPALQKLLADRPATFGERESIPVLPVFEAMQVFRAHVRYMSFQNGTGVRFITQYGQAYIPVNNQELFYTFQGLTADGKYNVSAFFPITHPDLPADDTIDPTLVDAAFDAYLVKTVAMLEAAGDGAFTPPLAALDAMMQSLEVK